VNDDFSILFELLETSPPEVVGRGSTTVSPELRKKLAKLAAGRCNEKERRELINLLEEQPDLVPVLVEEIKKLRNLPNVRNSGGDE
jgi:hypothetical protein